MPFNVGDAVYVWAPDVIRHGQLVRIMQVLPKRLSQQDFQEYVIEFLNEASERFRFCLYREFELRVHQAEIDMERGSHHGERSS